MTTVSVIIPTCDRASLIGRALDSVLAQDRPPEEIIVVDDGSPDHTAEVVARHCPRAVYLRQENRGVSAARNRGTCAAHYVLFVNYEDFQAAIEAQARAVDGDPVFLCRL